MSQRRMGWSRAAILLLAIPAAAQVNSIGARQPGAITNTGFGYTLLNSIQGYPLPGGRNVFGGVNNLAPLGGIYPFLTFPSYYPPFAPAPPMVISSPPQPPVVLQQTIVTGPNGETKTPQDEQQVTSFTAPPASSDMTTPRVTASAIASPGPSNVYLIAFKGGAIQAAVAYWYEDGALHYVSTDHTLHQATLSSVDNTLSEALNKQRGIDFHPMSP